MGLLECELQIRKPCDTFLIPDQFSQFKKDICVQTWAFEAEKMRETGRRNIQKL